MERYRQFVLVEQIKENIKSGKRDDAIELALRLDITRVKDYNDLSDLADLFLSKGMIDRAEECLLKLYARQPGRGISMQLVNLYLIKNDVVNAKKYAEAFENLSKNDYYNYIFKYNISRLERAPYSTRIEILEQLCSIERIDCWEYELAKLYHKVGDKEKCVAECDEIELWFGSGEYVERARALKAYYRGEIDITAIPEIEIIEEEIDIEAEERAIAEQEAKEAQAEAERVAAEKRAAEEAEAERLAAEKQAAEEAEAERLAAEEQAAEEAEAERLAAEKQAAEEAEAERLAAEKQAAEEAEARRLATEKQIAAKAEAEQPSAEKQAAEIIKTDSRSAYKTETVELEMELDSEDEPIPVVSPEVLAEAENESMLAADLSAAVEDVIKGLEAEEMEETKNHSFYKGRMNEIAPGFLKSFLDRRGESIEDYFGFMAVQPETSAQIIKALDILLNPQIKCLSCIITGSKYSGRTTICKGLAEILNRAGFLSADKYAVTDAIKLNKMQLSEKISKLTGSCLVVDRAGQLSAFSTKSMESLDEIRSGKVAIVLTDGRQEINKLLKNYKQLNTIFTVRIHIPDFKAEDLKEMVYYELKLKNYKVSDSVLNLLLKEVDTIYKIKAESSVKTVKELLNRVFDNTENRMAAEYIRLSRTGATVVSSNVITEEDVRAAIADE